jgi:hypothetical protein
MSCNLCTFYSSPEQGLKFKLDKSRVRVPGMAFEGANHRLQGVAVGQPRFGTVHEVGDQNLLVRS